VTLSVGILDGFPGDTESTRILWMCGVAAAPAAPPITTDAVIAVAKMTPRVTHGPRFSVTSKPYAKPRLNAGYGSSRSAAARCHGNGEVGVAAPAGPRDAAPAHSSAFVCPKFG
jgi:hypothetical protein